MAAPIGNKTEVGFFIVDNNGVVFGEIDKSRLDKVKWYQRLLAKFSKRYKSKFIDIVPFAINENSKTDNFAWQWKQ